MKKIIVVALTFVLFCTVLVGCGKDDADSKDTGETTAAATEAADKDDSKGSEDIVGVWEMDSVKANGAEMDIKEYLKSIQQEEAPTFEFKKDNEFVINNWGGQEMPNTGVTWAEEGGKYVIKAQDTAIGMEFVIKGDTLVMENAGSELVFTKKK